MVESDQSGDHRVTLPTCVHCVRAKALLARRGIRYEEVGVSGVPRVRHWFAEQTGGSTVPQITIDGIPIGGADRLAGLDRWGILSAIAENEQFRSCANSGASPRIPWRTGRQHGSEVSAEYQRCNDLSSGSTARVGSSRPSARARQAQANPVTSTGAFFVDARGNAVIIFDGCAKQRTPPASAGQEVIASTRDARACPVGSRFHYE